MPDDVFSSCQRTSAAFALTACPLHLFIWVFSKNSHSRLNLWRSEKIMKRWFVFVFSHRLLHRPREASKDQLIQQNEWTGSLRKWRLFCSWVWSLEKVGHANNAEDALRKRGRWKRRQEREQRRYGGEQIDKKRISQVQWITNGKLEQNIHHA